MGSIDVGVGWVLTRSFYSYCERCQLFKNGSFWRYFVTPIRSTHCVCDECAKEEVGT